MHVLGWDNLNIALPSGIPLQMSIQTEVNANLREVRTLGSNFSGPLMLAATRAFGGNQSNFTIGQTLAARLSVSDAPPTGQGFEGDVAERPNGDGSVLSNDVVQVRRFLNGTDIPDPTVNEFQRADSAPFADKGDGLLNSADVVQTRRYQNGTSPQQTAGGPITAGSRPEEILTSEVEKTKAESESPKENSRQVRVESTNETVGRMITVNILVDAVGDEAEYGFSLKYDSSMLSKPIIRNGTAGATVRSCNTKTVGVIRCSIGGFANNNLTSNDAGIGEIAAGDTQILITVTFTVAANASAGDTSLTLSNVNASSDAPQLFTPATTSSTDSNGETRLVVANPFDYYRFEDIAADETYIFSVSHKRYSFVPQVLMVTEEMEDLNFTAQP